MRHDKTKPDNLLWHLLRCNVSPAQLTAYALSNFVGLAVILTALQLYIEVSALFESGDSLISHDFICVSPKIEGFGSISTGQEATIDSTEMADIARQPWSGRVGAFTTARYNIAASLDMGGRSMTTSLFFESVPDEFFDITPPGWSFDPSHPEIPIVVSRDYLTLYNFGFASSHGLPQLSENMIGLVPLKVSVSGRGRQQWIPARIVGFSSRLNTIAVPDEFMQWANDNFGEGEPSVSRLIVELSKPGDPQIKEYFKTHNLEIAGDNASNSAASYMLTVLTATVVGIGVAICLLSFLILMLSICLLLQKNREKLRDLMLLGYSPSTVARQYCRMIALINAVVCALAIATMLIVRGLMRSPLSRLGIDSTGPFLVICIGIGAVTALTLYNFGSIRLKMRQYFY